MCLTESRCCVVCLVVDRVWREHVSISVKSSCVAERKLCAAVRSFPRSEHVSQRRASPHAVQRRFVGISILLLYTARQLSFNSSNSERLTCLFVDMEVC